MALADEVESLGKRDRREAGSRLGVILTHMLEIQYEPETESASWRNTIKTQRRDLAKVLADSPSLRPQVAELLPGVYQYARSDAADETGLALDTFPEMCPWTVAEMLGE